MRHTHSGVGLLALTMLVSLPGNTPSSATSVSPCTSRLLVELTPDVPDPMEPGFLSSLLNDHPGYRLIWIGRKDAFVIILKLTGPGPGQRCRAVIETMRKDGRVLSVKRDASPPG